MKTVACEVCGAGIQGEDFDAWFKASHTHWVAQHADVMKEMENKPKEEGMKWMAEAKKKFDAA